MSEIVPGRDPVSEVLLERFKFAMGAEFPEEWFQDAVNPEAHFDHFLKSWILTVRTSIYGERLREIIYPVTWWDAFKERFFPLWLKARFPVRHQRWTIAAMYPCVSLPREQHVLRVLEGGA